ncbi:hypothetical protein PsorP6_005272 [Peronosclerospora sorghi]|uniref:Uncharacterized protein n=1 Tax=Peronosclerospora sorghi TaxID=230839 RepID=A0ACC0W441_9STRA|nr:hypothetical protein PsorP6_005272 [Peronosclerospora sorghi]
MTYKKLYVKARKESNQTGLGGKDHHRRSGIFTSAALLESMCPLYERMTSTFGKKPYAAPIAIFDSTAAEGDLCATLADTPEEADADEDESDHPISDWQVTSRAAAASDNNNGERATNTEHGERETGLYDGEDGIVAPKARITEGTLAHRQARPPPPQQPWHPEGRATVDRSRCALPGPARPAKRRNGEQ